MDSRFETKADSFPHRYASMPERLEVSSGALKRKRAGDDFEPRTIGNPKRSKYRQTPCFPCARSGSERSSEVRVAHAPSCSVALAVYVPGHDPQALDESGISGVLPSTKEPSDYYKESQLDLRRMWHKPPACYTPDKGSDSATRKTTRRNKTDSMTIVERKHFFIYTPTEGMKAAAKKSFSDIYQLLDMSGSNDDCRFHPTPPHFNGKAAGTISFGFSWRDDHGPHRLTANWGIIALAVRQQLTDAQEDGFINQSWQLSHLCGNWTCCNWRHFTVESGHINRNRNGCFNSSAKCTHNPPCMKEKKRQLLLTDHIRSGISNAITSLGAILSYEAFHALADYEVRLIEGLWENSKQGFCAFCGRSDDKAHICSCLSSLAKCKVMLRALMQCAKPRLEMRQAIDYLFKIREDLEKGNAIKDQTLTQRLAHPEDQTRHCVFTRF